MNSPCGEFKPNPNNHCLANYIVKKKILVAALPLLKLFFWLAGLMPRDPKRWAFGAAANSFTDNAKYLFAHVSDKEPDIHAAWISANPAVVRRLRSIGVRAHYRWSIAGFWHALRSKYWFYCSYPSDINYYASRGACLINLWHGIPLKKIEFDIDSGRLARQYSMPTWLEKNLFFAANFKRPDWVLSTSEFVSTKSFASAFRIDRAHCLDFGYPRLDPFFWSAEQRSHWASRWGSTELQTLISRVQHFDRVFVYMPTWRDHNPNFLSEVGLDFSALNTILQAKNAILVLKLHMNTPPSTIQLASGHSNIHLMDPKDDIYPLLPETSALITDYSSIFLDYLLLERPICFFTFDVDRYLQESRSMYHSYTEFAQGTHVNDAAGLAGFLEGNFDDLKSGTQTLRQGLRTRLFKHSDDQASARIVTFFKADPHGTH